MGPNLRARPAPVGSCPCWTVEYGVLSESCSQWRIPVTLGMFRLTLLLLGLAIGFQTAQAGTGPKVTWQEILATPVVNEGLLDDAKSFSDIVPPRFVAKEGIRPFTEVLKAVYETFEDPPETQYFF